MYGTEPGKASFANNCLLARRLVERGVRFVQLYHRGWDTHGASAATTSSNSCRASAARPTVPAAALLKDLKQRGLLDETLVVWGGEFGRTPMNEARNGSKFLGRDHHPRAFTMWMAGGGIKPGVTIGKTDELGYNVVEDPVDVHDLHATMLHLLGIDHTKLTYEFQGRDFRLTDVQGNVVTKLMAYKACGAVALMGVTEEVREALAWLEKASTRRDLANLERFGIAADHAFGVSMGDVQALGKRIGRDHALALALWETG